MNNNPNSWMWNYIEDFKIKLIDLDLEYKFLPLIAEIKCLINVIETSEENKTE